MSRRPARCTQADITRALKAAERHSPDMAVEVTPDGTIRIVRNPAIPAPSSWPVETRTRRVP
jgi:hypothetical protein